MLTAAYALEDRAKKLALYLALFEVRPSVPHAFDELSGYARTNYVAAVSNATSCALGLGDIALATRMIEPMLGIAREFPFLAHMAACVFVASGKTYEALGQVNVAAESGYANILDLETDADLAPLHAVPAFQQVFREVKERNAMAALTHWPSGIPVPPRLADLARFLTAPGSWGTIGDFELGPLYGDYLAKMWAQDESDVFLEHFAKFPPKIGFFMRDGGGGELGLWMVGDSWPVVSIDSEGTHLVLGDDLDDFLRRVAGRKETEEEDDEIRAWQDKVSAWVRSLGLAPYERPEERLEHLTRRTLEFERWCAEERRTILAHVFPDRPLRFEAVPGDRVGPIRLGAPQAEVDAALSEPSYASWQKEDAPELTAFYPASPYVVGYKRATRTVAEVTLYASWPLLSLPGRLEPLFATVQDAESWLRSQGKPFRNEGGALTCDALGLTMRLACGPAPPWRYPESRWVDGITFRVPMA